MKMQAFTVLGNVIPGDHSNEIPETTVTRKATTNHVDKVANDKCKNAVIFCILLIEQYTPGIEFPSALHQLCCLNQRKHFTRAHKLTHRFAGLAVV